MKHNQKPLNDENLEVAQIVVGGGLPTISSYRRKNYQVICGANNFNPQTSRNIYTKCQTFYSFNKDLISPFSDTILVRAIGLCELLHYTMVLTKFFELGGSIFTSFIRMQGFD